MSKKAKKAPSKTKKKNKKVSVQKKPSSLKSHFDEFWMDDFYQPLGIFDEDFIVPDMNLSETKDAYKVTVELAGIDKKDLDVKLKDGFLFIKGEKNESDVEQGENYYRHECSYGSVHRTIKMPSDIKPESMDAKYANGVLKITVKKDRNIKNSSKRISVK